jgi:hypothetical protein
MVQLAFIYFGLNWDTTLWLRRFRNDPLAMRSDIEYTSHSGGIGAEEQMMIRKPFKIALIVSCWALMVSACDTDESIAASTDASAAEPVEAEVTAAELALRPGGRAELALRPGDRAELAFDWDSVALPAIPGTGGVTPAFEPPPATPVVQPWTAESFYLSSEANFLTLTSMEGGLFAPLPMGMPSLPPELEDGFLLGFTFSDENGEIVGFGTEQEVLDLVEATGETTYTLTIPGRGSLMLAQGEEFAYMFEEINDMVADQEFVREFDPPLVNIHTVPGSARIIGGTGEFAHVKGFWREISIIYKLDLVTGLHEVGAILQILHS